MHDIGSISYVTEDPLQLIWDAEYEFTDRCTGLARGGFFLYRSGNRWKSLPTGSWARFKGRVAGLCVFQLPPSGDLEDATIEQADFEAALVDRDNYGCCNETVALQNRAAGSVRLYSHYTHGRMVDLPFRETIGSGEVMDKLVPYRFKAAKGQRVNIKWRGIGWSRLNAGSFSCSGSLQVSYDVSMEGGTLRARRQALAAYSQGIDGEGVIWCASSFTASASAIYHMGIFSAATCLDTGDDPEQQMPTELLEVDIW